MLNPAAESWPQVEGWRLFHRKASPAAALSLGKLLYEKLTCAISEDPLDFETAARIRDEMYEAMKPFAELGAGDTEPEEVLVFTIAAAFGQRPGSLTRWTPADNYFVRH